MKQLCSSCALALSTAIGADGPQGRSGVLSSEVDSLSGRNLKASRDILWKELGTMTNLLELGVEDGRFEMGLDDVYGGNVSCLSTLTNLTGLHLPEVMRYEGFQALTCLTAISDLSCCVDRLDVGLESLQAFSALSSLMLYNMSESWGKRIGALDTLVDLNLSLEDMVADVGYLSTLTALTSLTISSSDQDDYGGIQQTFPSGLTGLKKLHLKCISDSLVDSVSLLTCLTDLDLSFWPYTDATDSLLQNLAILLSLTQLSLRGCRHTTDGGLAQLTELTGLAVLGLSGPYYEHACMKITDVGVMQLAALPFLRRLDLEHCEGVEMAVAAVLRKW